MRRGHRMSGKLTNTDVCARYVVGETLAKVAADDGRSLEQIRRIVLRAGIKTRRPGSYVRAPAPEIIERAAEWRRLIGQGLSQRQIAAQYGVHQQTVSRHVRSDRGA